MNKRGYKNTPIGLIPEDWDFKNIGDAFIICNNLRFPISEEIRKTMQGEYPYYGPTKVQDFINEYRVEGKYALIGEDGDHFLKWSQLPMTLLVEGRFNVNNHAHLIKGEHNLTEWFYYFFNHRELTPYLTRQGAGRYKLTKEALSKIPIPLPPFSEQRHIVDVLSSWDVALAKEQQLIDALQTRHRALMQQLLSGKKRLKGFNEEWKEVKLSKLFERVTQKNIEGNTTVVTISAQRGFVMQTDFFNKNVASDITDGYFLVKRGEFCYNKSYSNGYPWGTIKRLTQFEKAVVTTLYICFGIKDNTNSYASFFEHYFEAGLLDKGLMKIAHEGGRAHGLLNVTPNDFFNLTLHIPLFEEQAAIARILNTSEKEIQTHRRRLTTLQQQKKGLMQILLTGKVRVKV